MLKRVERFSILPQLGFACYVLLHSIALPVDFQETAGAFLGPSVDSPFACYLHNEGIKLLFLSATVLFLSRDALYVATSHLTQSTRLKFIVCKHYVHMQSPASLQGCDCRMKQLHVSQSLRLC